MTGAPLFATDDMLAYRRSRRRFAAGEQLLFDEPYRYAHLPLLAPDHSLSIDAPDGLDYRAGRYDATRYSLVVPVSQSGLAASQTFQSVDHALRAASFAPKIRFDICEKRARLQHITISGGFQAADIPVIEEKLKVWLRGAGALHYRLNGPFVGAKNFGRMYFPAYPSVLEDQQAFGLLQGALGNRPTGFYGLGYYSLDEELSADETAELQTITDRFADQMILDMPVKELWLLATNDDLALSGRVMSRIACSS
jgi:hypothetical protein